jgi:hypothetical protein
MQPISSVSATIAAGATGLSGAVDLGYSALTGIVMPGTWVAASLTFQASADGTNYFNLYDNGTEVSLTVAADRFIQIDPAKWRGIRYLKVRSGAAGAAVNQTATRVLTLVVTPEV